jgi:membrane-bound lytic murein transglycosylase MltF
MILFLIPVALGVFLFSRKVSASEAPPNKKMFLSPTWTKYDGFFKRWATAYGVDWKWLKAIAMNESSLGLHPSVALGLKDPTNKASVSDDKLSWGLMQMRLDTAKQFDSYATIEDLNNPTKIIKYSAQFLEWVIKQFPRDSGESLRRKVIMSYNQGVGNTLKGKTYASGYYDKFLKHLEYIKD